MDSNLTNHMKQALENLNQVVACTVAGYPISLARTLMQLGYEPLKPINGRYPSVVKYLRYIKNEKGFTALYTGLPFHLSYVIAQKITHYSLDCVTLGKNSKLQQDDGNEDKDDPIDDCDFNDIICHAFRESYIKMQTTIIVYPIFTIGLNYITSFFFTTSRDSLMEGLYKGLLPRLLFEVATSWAVSISWGLTRKYFKDRPPIEQQLYSRPGPLIVSTLLYPLNVVTVVMADNGRTNPKFDDWKKCYSYLRRMGAHRRGSALFWRGVAVPKGIYYFSE